MQSGVLFDKRCKLPARLGGMHAVGLMHEHVEFLQAFSGPRGDVFGPLPQALPLDPSVGPLPEYSDSPVTPLSSLDACGILKPPS